ncbi:MAG: helix-turn-helix transcriptional regulator [Deltaproteobacteria bacterium]
MLRVRFPPPPLLKTSDCLVDLKEVASVRSVSDATARQQVRAVYKKAGLSGRHDLAAFFLEDLMLPAEAGDN